MNHGRKAKQATNTERDQEYKRKRSEREESYEDKVERLTKEFLFGDEENSNSNWPHGSLTKEEQDKLSSARLEQKRKQYWEENYNIKVRQQNAINDRLEKDQISGTRPVNSTFRVTYFSWNRDPNRNWEIDYYENK